MFYEFTITLKPMMYKYDAGIQYEMTKDILMNVFYPNNMLAYKVSCIAELTQENNVHYHAFIELDTIMHKDKLLNKFRKHNLIIGKKSLTQVVYEDSYKKYMIKDLDLTRQIIGDPIVCDYYGIGKMTFVQEGIDIPADHMKESEQLDFLIEVVEKRKNRLKRR